MGQSYDVPKVASFIILATIWSLCISPLSADEDSICPFQPCWDEYETASTYYQAELEGQVDGDARKCATYRTYKKCMVALDSNYGCANDLYYRSINRAIQLGYVKFNCTEEGPTYPDGPTPSPLTHDATEQRVCHYTGLPFYNYCTLFGDPHLRMFNGNQQTCLLRGAWPLIDNKFLTVQVTNEYISAALSGATVTKRVTVIVKAVNIDKPSDESCGSRHALFYHAEAGSLPTTFADGQREHGAYNSITIESIVPGEHVEINLSYVSMKVVIRQLQSEILSVGVQIPDRVLNGTIHSPNLIPQLCLHGCPDSQTIDLPGYLSNPGSIVITQEAAENICREAGTGDFFYDSCVFDVLMTGNPLFSSMAANAYTDVRNYATLQPEWHNRTNIDIYTKRSAQLHKPPSSSPNCARVETLSLTILFVYTMHVIGSQLLLIV